MEYSNSVTFYALHLPNVDEERIPLLQTAAERLGIQFCAVDPYSFDFSKPSPVKKGDIVYRVSRGKLLRVLEDFFIRPGVATFYEDPMSRKGDPFTLSKYGIPTPKTIFCSTKKRRQLIEYVEALGGLPIILKALGGTRGLGVMRIDSLSSLLSMADYLLSQNKFFTLLQYIPVKSSARFVVLGGRVIAAHEYLAKDGDFRTNVAAKPKVQIKKYTPGFEKIAIQAVSAFGLEFGGVDMLIHGRTPYIAEVNFPCNFVRAQKLLQRDIAFDMVRYLQRKAAHLSKTSVHEKF